ncbi:MAG TPA: host attachment protein [Gammaproteobacteria bacterium]|nr:host attachment protein [Gammaproteobacteria bacterium]
MAKIWVVVGDNSRARMFATNRAAPLEEREDYVPAYDPGQDKERFTDRTAHQGHVAEGGRDPAAEADRRFVRRIAGRLREARLAGEYERLFLVAPPVFLGELRQALDSGTREVVVGEAAKNLSQLRADDIRAHLPELL